MKKRFIAAVAAAALVSAAPARAQTDTVPAYQQVISANPLGLLFGYFNGEYERAISSTSTAGVAGAYFSADNDALATIEAKFRYYPQARPLSGFSIGASLGYGQVTDEEDFDEFIVDSQAQQDDGPTSSAFIVGVELNYNWLVGRDRRFFIGTGIGARRLLGGDVDNESDLPVVIPSIRLVNIGFAF
ncbi:MAG TPA: hypothetical protein VF584_05700 [Longimicrobium sp.]|jgi:hypothetical protein